MTTRLIPLRLLTVLASLSISGCFPAEDKPTRCDVSMPGFDCRPFLIGQLPDGSTATVERMSVGNTGG